MKILFVPFLLSLIFFVVSCNIGPKGPFFWKAEKEGKTFYILGTIHEGVGLEDLQCSQVISDILDQSNLLWTEVNMFEVQEILKNQQSIVQELSMDVSGQSFQSLSEPSQNFFKTKLPAEALQTVQQMSYFGLYRSCLRIAGNTEQESCLR